MHQMVYCYAIWIVCYRHTLQHTGRLCNKAAHFLLNVAPSHRFTTSHLSRDEQAHQIAGNHPASFGGAEWIVSFHIPRGSCVCASYDHLNERLQWAITFNTLATHSMLMGDIAGICQPSRAKQEKSPNEQHFPVRRLTRAAPKFHGLRMKKTTKI